MVRVVRERDCVSPKWDVCINSATTKTRGISWEEAERCKEDEEESWELQSSGHDVTTEVTYSQQLPVTCTRPKTKSARFSASLEEMILRPHSY